MSLPPRRVSSKDWSPVGVNQLEANALKVVRSTAHRSVLAGPGAGKTELLAQRAAYLLQTGACPAPRRILAIAFKRDAARNLGQRVGQRCHRDHARRLDSVTFDAFAKSLLDRFGQALPVPWRPTPDYEILFPKGDLFRGLLQSASTARRQRSGHPRHLARHLRARPRRTHSSARRWLDAAFAGGVGR